MPELCLAALVLGVKVPGNTARALLQLRERLNRKTLARAIDMLAAADRIALFAVGHVGAVADDAQFKFLLFGVPSLSYTDPRLQLLATKVLKPTDVAVIISNTGRIDDLLGLADVTRQRGAPVLAITAGNSPLARKPDVTSIVDHAEDRAKHVPMISRILRLLMIDILAVGVAMLLRQPGGRGTGAGAARWVGRPRCQSEQRAGVQAQLTTNTTAVRAGTVKAPVPAA